ncbi:hypothetical protein Bca4012_056203 [Brassica carinata]
MTSQNGDAHPVVDSPSSPYQQLRQDTLKAYETMYGSLDNHYSIGNTPFSPLSDLQILESGFGRLGVSDSNARKRQLLDHRRSNQYPFGGRDQGMNVRDYYNPREQLDQAAQRLWFSKDNHYDFHESYGSDGHRNSGVTGRPPYIGFNGDLVEVPLTSRNHNLYDQSPWSFSHVPRTRTNHHDPYTMNNSRAKDTILSRAKDVLESTKIQKVIVEGSRDIVDKIFDELKSHVCELMVDPVGHQVFQKLIEKCTGEQINQILDIVIQQPIQFVRICGDTHGNYAVQYVLEMENCQVAASLSRYLDGHYVQLSFDKFGSHVVQKCLETRQFNSRRIINELISDIDSILVDRFGNYVIQTAWVVSQDDMRSKLLYHINKNYPLMRCNMYGRKVLEKLGFRT